MTETPTIPSTGKVSAKLIETVNVALDAHIGRAAMTVGELAALEPGAIVPLDAALNRLVELRLNGIAVAHGELVAVGDRFGVRLTDIVSWPE